MGPTARRSSSPAMSAAWQQNAPQTGLFIVFTGSLWDHAFLQSRRRWTTSSSSPRRHGERRFDRHCSSRFPPTLICSTPYVQNICSKKRGLQMTATQRRSLTLTDLLNAANKHYDDSYLSVYFDVTTGGPRTGSGDSLAEFIVSELRESFDGQSSRERQVSVAVRMLEGAKQDIQNAIH